MGWMLLDDVIGWSGLNPTEQLIAVLGGAAGFGLYWTLRMALQALFGGIALRRAKAKKRKKAKAKSKSKAKVGGRR